MNVASSTAPDTRFSRYRSVRKAVRKEAETPVASDIPLIPEVPDASVNRAPSRYRKTTAQTVPQAPPQTQTSHVVGTAIPELPSVPKLMTAVSSKHEPGRLLAATPSIPIHNCSPPIRGHAQRIESPPQQVSRYPARRTRSKTVTSPQQHAHERRRSYDLAREEARMILEGEYDRLQKLKDQQHQRDQEQKRRVEAKLAQRQAEEAKAAELKAEAVRQEELQRVAENAEKRAQKELRSRQRLRGWTIGGHASNTPVRDGTSEPSASVRQSGQGSYLTPVECLPPVSSRDVHPSSPKYHDQPRLNRSTKSLGKKSTANVSQKAVTTVHAYQPKLGDRPPQTANNVTAPITAFDAPVSAVNAGERRVEIRYDKSTITLPVTPTTTAKDLMNSASLIMSQSIDPRATILVENFVHLGLERPLRRYERVRDVMNSWDSDTQNHLVISSDNECAAAGLEQQDAPTEPPWKTVLQLHHSQKPGKWEKHWMTLRSDGQVTCLNKNNDIDASNAFHLSDFDIYMPTKRQIKTLKPPKTICFAIKSQQRSIMFESTENFVHFFCTNDKEIADKWYNSVQAWRSYYLVHVLGAGVSNNPIPTNALEAVAANARPSTSHSRDSVPYQLGTFETLLDFSVDQFRYSLHATSALDPSSNMLTRKASLVNRAKNAQPANSDHSRQRTSPQRLGSIKSDRMALHARERSLVKDTSNRSLDQGKSQATGRGMSLSSTTEEAFTGKGLLANAFDLNKPYEVVPGPYDDTSQGFTGKGLLSRSLSKRPKPQAETKTFLNINDDPSAFTGVGLLSHKPTKTTSATTTIANPNAEFVPESTDNAFTGGGLLRKLTTKKSQIREARPGQPLVDLGEQSTFQGGSLLRQVEDYYGSQAPIIDRTKGHEITQKVGEGY